MGQLTEFSPKEKALPEPRFGGSGDFKGMAHLSLPNVDTGGPRRDVIVAIQAAGHASSSLNQTP